MRNGDLVPGNTLPLGWLNGLRDLSGRGTLKIDPRTGLKLIVTPFGSLLRAIFPPDGWFQVTVNHGGGSYALVSQIEASGGGWSNGPRTVSIAYEANLYASVPSGTGSTGARVWATFRRGTWRFTYGKCSIGSMGS